MMRKYARRSGRASGGVVHHFKRVVKISDITASWSSAGGAVNIAGAYAFSLDSLPNYTEFTALYDMYKIKGVKLSFVPSGNSYMTSTVSGITSAVGFSRFHSVIDYDDLSTPANETTLLQYNTLRSTPGYRIHNRFVKPRVQMSVLDDNTAGTVAPAAIGRAGQWLDTDNPTIDHTGIKIWCSAPINSGATAGTSITYSVYATYYLAFKMTR